MLHTGCCWRDLPVELGCGSGHTAWRRLRAWQEAGVWEKLARAVLEELSEQEILDWSRASIDAVSVRAKRGGGRADRPEPHRPRETGEEAGDRVMRPALSSVAGTLHKGCRTPARTYLSRRHR